MTTAQASAATTTETRVTQYAANGDAAVTVSVFSHPELADAIPAALLEAWAAAQAEAIGTSFPYRTPAEAVYRDAWRPATISGLVAIGDENLDGTLTIEVPEDDDPRGCPVLWWWESDSYDTGLRVWRSSVDVLLAAMAVERD